MPKGEKYHKGTCRYVNEEAWTITLEEAVAMGYTPCKVCHPSGS